MGAPPVSLDAARAAVEDLRRAYAAAEAEERRVVLQTYPYLRFADEADLLTVVLARRDEQGRFTLLDARAMLAISETHLAALEADEVRRAVAARNAELFAEAAAIGGFVKVEDGRIVALDPHEGGGT